MAAADERAFETLHTPESQRAAIRHLNDAYALRLRATLAAEPLGLGDEEHVNFSVARNSEADSARRAALDQALGPEGATAFSAVERKLVRGLRIKLPQSDPSEGGEAAPTPGPPGSP